MNITQLVTKLEELKAKHGDLEVFYRDWYEGGFCKIHDLLIKYPFKKGEWREEDKTQPAYQIELI